ncbi:MarR family winged helix-turn-helix transcriptional regulator [Methylomonas sp. SURF-2]|uniref:MarR family winged helix-turn-helix transcriptional regulator n=1 Tax=Methylomonas subterranea TaxID=2952225 RepID=A0ABT1TG99_9GAMM|nr:MarR family winged helix-turn-helix transcriptional regulator [Methylomonas sp. SURF-2]MCQ8104485.1 MarR family winged helix-turn-helix transcriptional regulator [Methylomonas sp. SURF-2]
MHELETFKLIERISSLLRSEERKKYAAIGLQPVHGQVLEYLAKCNRYSNTHASVAEYLGLTKGTVSQSIQILERKRYLQKTTDSLDGRVVHLSLTEAGMALVDELKPLDIFKQAEREVSHQEFDSIGNALQTTLSVLQKVNQSKSFGMCRSCEHFRVVAHHYQCGMTDEALERDDTDKICRDHIPKPNPVINQE